MHYVEIAEDIINAIKGGAGGGSDQTETEEVVGYITGFSTYFSEVVKMVLDFIYSVADAIKNK